MVIKNIIFDVGNVLFHWDPESVVIRTFPDVNNTAELTKAIFKHQIWFDLNQGLIDESQAIALYQERMQGHAAYFKIMMDNVRSSLVPLEESIALLNRLSSHYALYALTDNTIEIMAHLRQKYDIWPLFKGVVVSAEVKQLKPSEAIYRHLLDVYALQPHETVFIDDLLKNVLGARNVGIKAIQFLSIEQCMADLKRLGINHVSL